MPLAVFVAFHDIAEDTVGVRAPRFAVTLARARGGIALVYSRYRQVWELPGGLIDPGESARDCAAREFAEETSGAAGELEWLGIVEVNDGSTHFGAVYRCTAVSLPENFDNWETGGLEIWTRQRAPRPLGNSDAALLDRFG